LKRIHSATAEAAFLVFLKIVFYLPSTTYYTVYLPLIKHYFSNTIFFVITMSN